MRHLLHVTTDLNNCNQQFDLTFRMSGQGTAGRFLSQVRVMQQVSSDGTQYIFKHQMTFSHRDQQYIQSVNSQGRTQRGRREAWKSKFFGYTEEFVACTRVRALEYALRLLHSFPVSLHGFLFGDDYLPNFASSKNILLFRNSGTEAPKMNYRPETFITTTLNSISMSVCIRELQAHMYNVHTYL